MTAGMHNNCRRGISHFACCISYQCWVYGGYAICPFGSKVPDMLFQLLKPVAVFLNVFLIVVFVVNYLMYPGQQQGEISRGLDGKPVLGFAGRCREPRVNSDDRGALIYSIRHLLYLTVVHVLPDVRSNEHKTACIAYVSVFRRTGILSEGGCKSHIARSAALCE